MKAMNQEHQTMIIGFGAANSEPTKRGQLELREAKLLASYSHIASNNDIIGWLHVREI